MTDEEWMSANLGPLSSDAPGTYTGDRIEELEEEIKRLRRMLGYTDATDGERSRFGAIQVRIDEYDRLREIERAAREYRKLVWVPAVMAFAGVETSGGYPVWQDYEDAQRKLDALLGKGAVKNG